MSSPCHHHSNASFKQQENQYVADFRPGFCDAVLAHRRDRYKCICSILALEPALCFTPFAPGQDTDTNVKVVSEVEPSLYAC